MPVLRLPTPEKQMSTEQLADIVMIYRKELQYLLNNLDDDNIPRIKNMITENIDYSIISNNVKADLIVDTAQIKDLAVSRAKIGIASIGSAQIDDLAVSTAHIKDLAVTTAKIDDAAITNAKIENATIEAAKIKNGTITYAQIADATITNAKIANSTITFAQIANATIKTANIESGAITTALIDTGAVNTAQIADASITDAKIVGLTANKITAGILSTERLEIRGTTSSIVYELNNITGALQAINVNTLNGEILTERTITADKIVANAITANEIAANTITANKLVSGTITAASGVIASIDASKITVGTLSGDRINGGTITGVTVTVDTTLTTGDKIILGSESYGITFENYSSNYYMKRANARVLKFWSNGLWVSGHIAIPSGQSIGVFTSGLESTGYSSAITLYQNELVIGGSGRSFTTKLYYTLDMNNSNIIRVKNIGGYYGDNYIDLSYSDRIKMYKQLDMNNYAIINSDITANKVKDQYYTSDYVQFRTDYYGNLQYKSNRSSYWYTLAKA